MGRKGMKVKTLIKQLQKAPQEAFVHFDLDEVPSSFSGLIFVNRVDYGSTIDDEDEEGTFFEYCVLVAGCNKW